ncbi:hypothetical protein ACFOWM_06225 [Ferruginibacter yonginensis]|uniref:Phage terminase large subunit N-terminal domain-containing protein n=1 Tax=Ferruginibacter yonginensis TaxID=1310416 RepID=A0ABV8QS16_9BACT
MMLSGKDKIALERYRNLLKQVSESNSVNPLESKKEQQERINKAKVDFAYFVNTYFPHYATAELAPFHIKLAKKIRADKRIKRLLGWGRGLAKSTMLDILIPLWLWINDDLKVMVLVGQNADKACILISDIQAEFEANPLLIHDYGAQRTIGSWEEGKFVTKNDCAFFALGMGESPRGVRHRQYRPDYIIADDLDTKEVCRNPKRVREYANWVCEDLLGTLDERGSRFIMVNNVFAPHTILTEIRDTRSGFTYDQQNATDENYNPTWAAKNTREFYLSQLEAMGALSFAAEYNNSPYVQGTVFTESMIQWAPIPNINHFDSIIGFWDVAYSEAKTADYNAIKVWGVKNGNFYLIKAFVRQCKMDVAIRWVNDYSLSLAKSATINWWFESQFWNDALMMVMHQVNKSYDEPVNFSKSEKPKGAKFDRMLNMLPYYQQRKIFYNQAEKNNADMQLGIAQLFGIEAGYKGHDDSPDADAQAIEKLSKRVRKTNAPYRMGKRQNFKF